MANNRLYIRCRGCRESMMVTKNFGEPFCLDEKEVDKLNTFFYEHAFCSNDDDGYSNGGRYELYDDFD